VAIHGNGFGKKNLVNSKREPSTMPIENARAARDMVVGIPIDT